MSIQGRLLKWCVLMAGVSLVALSLSAAGARCEISGESTAIPNPDDPILGAWKYCLELTWDTGIQHSVSHFTMLLGLEECECVCEEFPFAAQDTAGYSTGVDSSGAACTVYYYAAFNCQGDPSIGIEAPVVKFESFEDSCEPGTDGAGILCFYTDWFPRSVDLPNSWLALKAGGEACFGQLTGVVPECCCGPSPTENSSWGSIKSTFRR